MNRPLRTWEACQLADIVHAAQRSTRVARLLDDTVAVGTARSIGDDQGNHSKADQDIRDLFLRVTLLSGFDVYWPISDLMAEHDSGEFVTNYRPEE